MFRIVTCFELESHEKKDLQHRLTVEKPSMNEASVNEDPRSEQENPVKFLLYQPSISLLNSYIGNCFKDLRDRQCLVIYISGEGIPPTENTGEISYGSGGVETNRRSGTSKPHSAHATRKSHIKDMNCLYPGDLYPYTRKPLLLIVEGSNGLPFLQIPNLFGEPFMCVVSPQTVPQAVEDSMENSGGILTLFLSDPLMGLCKVCGLEHISEKSYTTCSVILKTFFLEAAKFFLKSKDMHFHVLCFFSDQFLRMVILKFLFCSYVLRLHRSFKNWTQWPKCHPQLSADIMDNVVLEKIIRDISVELDIQTLFNDSVRM